MSLKKNVVRYLLWCVYTVAVTACAVGAGTVLSRQMGVSEYYGLGVAAALAVLAGGAAFLLRWLGPGIAAYFAERKGLCITVEFAAAVLLFTVGLVFRVTNLSDMGDSAAYYEAAEVRMGQEISLIPHGASYLYVWLLRIVFLFFGNRFLVGVVLQMVLQGAAAVLLTLLIRKHIGSVASLVFLAFLVCSPYMVRGALTLSPAMSYLLLAAVSVSIAAVLPARKPLPVTFAAAGFGSALMTYLDATGALLFLSALCVVFALTGERFRKFSKKAELLACCVLGFAVGFMGCVLADCLTSGNTSLGALGTWYRLYRPEAFDLRALAGSEVFGMERLVLLLLLAVGIFSFWFRRGRSLFYTVFLEVLAAAAAVAFGVFAGEMRGGLWLYLLLVLLAGIGAQQCVTGHAAAAVRETAPDQTTEKRDEKEESMVQKELVEKEKPPVREEPMVTEKSAEKENLTVQAEPAGKEKTMEKKEEAAQGTVVGEKEKEPEKKEIRYLENPLPLPKKHERKVLDYDYPVADDDDFDIQ